MGIQEGVSRGLSGAEAQERLPRRFVRRDGRGEDARRIWKVPSAWLWGGNVDDSLGEIPGLKDIGGSPFVGSAYLVLAEFPRGWGILFGER